MESLLEKVLVQLKASKAFEKQNGASLSPEKSH
jgi:hypothetical protein